MINNTEAGIFPIESIPEFPMENAYTVERYGRTGLRLPQHVQQGSSFLYSIRYEGGEMHGQEPRDLERATSALFDYDSFHGGLPSSGVSMEMLRSRELGDVRTKLRSALVALQKLNSPYAEPVSEIEEIIVNEMVEENLAAARNKACQVGKYIADFGANGGNLWLIVNPPATDNNLYLIDEFEEGTEIKVAKLHGLAVFEQNEKVYARPVVQGKRHKVGQLMTTHYNSRHDYLYV